MNTKNNILKLNGVIVADKDYREYDKLLTILTQDKGKVSVYAFNVRKSNSKNIGKISLFTFGTFEVRENQDSLYLENVILKEEFYDLTKDYENVCYASYFIELASYVAFENLECDEIIDLLYFAFKALTKGIVDKKLVRRVFELKMIKYQGEYKDSSELPENNDTLKHTWDFVIMSLPQKLFSFKLSEEVFEEFDSEVDIEMKNKIGKKFKSLDLIDGL